MALASTLDELTNRKHVTCCSKFLLSQVPINGAEGFVVARLKIMQVIVTAFRMGREPEQGRDQATVADETVHALQEPQNQPLEPLRSDG